MIRSDVILEDTTLRDGEQAPGVAFNATQKIAIHDALVALGVRWIETGIPAMGGEELAAMQILLERGSPANLVAWNRGVRADVERSLDLGFRYVHIGLPTSDIHLKDSLGRDRRWLFSTAETLVKLAKDRGAFVSISAEDIGRSNMTFVQEYAAHVAEAGADRLRLSDTIGILSPEGYAERVRQVRAATTIDLQCHAHNDFGLAVANTLAGLEAGARYFHVTVNAIGERAGMPDLAQIVLALRYLHGIDLRFDLEHLPALSRLVGSCSGHDVAPWQPIVGTNVFAHESGIHARGTLQKSDSYEPFPPELVGGQRRIVIGKHSGRAGVQYVLARNGVDAPIDELGPCLDEVRAVAMRQGAALSDEQVVDAFRRTGETGACAS